MGSQCKRSMRTTRTSITLCLISPRLKKSGTKGSSLNIEKHHCRMHGGTSPGAPKGNKNAYKHGHYTADAIARRRSIAMLIRTGKKLRHPWRFLKIPEILNSQQSVGLSHRPTPSVVSSPSVFKLHGEELSRSSPGPSAAGGLLVLRCLCPFDGDSLPGHAATGSGTSIARLRLSAP
jgi:hypothetical protein